MECFESYGPHSADGGEASARVRAGPRSRKLSVPDKKKKEEVVGWLVGWVFSAK